MRLKRKILFMAAVVILITALCGCTAYTKLKMLPAHDSTVSIKKLIESFDDYHIYYSGYAPDNPSGIIFDARADHKILQPSKRWKKVETQAAVSEIISWIGFGDYPWYQPMLYEILGPDNQFFGFLYTGWQRLATKPLDENTLLIYDLPPPPQYHDFDNGIRDHVP